MASLCGGWFGAVLQQIARLVAIGKHWKDYILCFVVGHNTDKVLHAWLLVVHCVM